MILKIDVNKIAKEHLEELEKEIEIPLALVDSETIDSSFFSVFFYNSQDYIKSGNLSAMLMGNAPFIVNKKDGSIFITGTDQPVDFYIDKYRNDFE